MIKADILQMSNVERCMRDHLRILKRSTDTVKDLERQIEKVVSAPAISKKLENVIEEERQIIYRMSGYLDCLQNVMQMYSSKEENNMNYLEELAISRGDVTMEAVQLPDWIFQLLK